MQKWVAPAALVVIAGGLAMMLPGGRPRPVARPAASQPAGPELPEGRLLRATGGRALASQPARGGPALQTLVGGELRLALQPYVVTLREQPDGGLVLLASPWNMSEFDALAERIRQIEQSPAIKASTIDRSERQALWQTLARMQEELAWLRGELTRRPAGAEGRP